MIVTEPIIYRNKITAFEDLKDGSTIPLECACDECGDVFTTTKWRITRNGHQLCQRCALRAKQRKDMEVGSKWGRLTVIGRSDHVGYSICRCECGNTGEYYNTLLRNGRTTSCGCQQKDVARRIAATYLNDYSGDKHPNWKGGVTDERHTVESSKEYKAFRKEVLRRDGYMCQKCGATDNLCVHHILDFMANPELRCDVSNGITLCRPCHEQFHRIYGKGTKSGYGDFGHVEINEYLGV